MERPEEVKPPAKLFGLTPLRSSVLQHRDPLDRGLSLAAVPGALAPGLDRLLVAHLLNREPVGRGADIRRVEGSLEGWEEPWGGSAREGEDRPLRQLLKGSIPDDVVGASLARFSAIASGCDGGVLVGIAACQPFAARLSWTSMILASTRPLSS